MKRIHSHSVAAVISKNGGFTLIELMIALALSGIVMIAIGTAFVSQQQVATAQEQVAEVQQNIRAGLYVMEREIRMAGYNPNHNAFAGITIATATEFRFTMVADQDGVDNNNDGTTDETGELATISYRLYDAYGDGDMDLGREVVTAASLIQAVVENIDAIEFFYTMADGTQTLAPAQLGDIRAVQISILARAGFPDPKFVNTTTYIPASGNAAWDINGAAAGTGNPANDNFRRRLLITTIQCRNMGI